MNSCWYCPGFNESGIVRNMYRYARLSSSGKMGLMGTTGMGQQMYGVNLYDARKPHLILTEGVWDAMALWEVFRQCRWNDENGLVHTASNKQNLLATANIVGLPGCTTFLPKWGKLLAGKIVTFMFDNDLDRKHKETGKDLKSEALAGIRRVLDIVGGTNSQPKEVHYLKWGDERDYFSNDLPHGFDVRDSIQSW